MKLGIGLPSAMARETDRPRMLEWARLAEEAGFHELESIHTPNFDSWDPPARRLRRPEAARLLRRSRGSR
jgi:hypothetical protein